MTISAIGRTNRLMINSADNKPGISYTSLTGFTLIELLCVIVIIALFFSLSVPSLSKTAGNFYLRNKASKIKAICELLKRNSIAENRAYKLVIDYSKNSYSVLRRRQDSTEEFSLVKDSLLRARVLPESLSFYSPENNIGTQEIIFKQNGTISSAVFFITNSKDKPVKLSTTLSGEILLEYL